MSMTDSNGLSYESPGKEVAVTTVACGLTLDVSIEEKHLIRTGLRRLRQSTQQQRAISERNLVEGCQDIDVAERLALHEERELASLDVLLGKLSYQ